MLRFLSSRNAMYSDLDSAEYNTTRPLKSNDRFIRLLTFFCDTRFAGWENVQVVYRLKGRRTELYVFVVYFLLPKVHIQRTFRTVYIFFVSFCIPI
jgi:hypothetical protein